MSTAKSIAEYQRQLSNGALSSRELLQHCLSRMKDPRGEGQRIFIRSFEAQATAAAAASDAMRASGVEMPALAGLPISVKDLFDVRGVTTLAGSKALADRPPAERDAPALARLRAAGAVVTGTTNMTEFAFGALGLNPHYGTPLNPFDRAHRRVPGGSSSGAAVSVADEMSVVSIGTDTGGSVRIPAALCGIVGFKPTARRVPSQGVVPLAKSLDSVGVLGATVSCCARVDAIMAGEDNESRPPVPLHGLRLAIPQTLVLDNLDSHVARAFSRAMSLLSRAGCTLTDQQLPELAEITPWWNTGAGFMAAEAYAWHCDLLERKRHEYDPMVAKRISSGAAVSAKDYMKLSEVRRELGDRVSRATRDFDAVILPTTAIVAPLVHDVQDEAEWFAINRVLSRNTLLGNFLDRCAVSLPCHEPGGAPVGLMMMGETMADHRLLDMAHSVEAVLASHD